MNIQLGRSGEGVSEKEERVGRKGITCTQTQTFYQTPFAHEQGVIVQFYWLVACWSKHDTRNLTFIHNPTPEHDKIKIRKAKSEELFEISVWDMLKDLSPNWKLFDLKHAIRV